MILKWVVIFFLSVPLFSSEIVGFFSGTLGDGRSYRNGYETAGILVALDNPCVASPFIEGRFHRVDRGRFAANGGVGWRRCFFDLKQLFGINFFYDYRRLAEVDFNQWGVGLEVLGVRFLRQCFDIRLNGYFPFGRREAFADAEVFSFDGGFIAIEDQFYAPMPGGDMELGWCLANCGRTLLYGGIGPYYYHSHCCHSILGGMARLRGEFMNCLEVELLMTYDDLFGFRPQGRVGCFFSFSNLCCWRKRCYFPIVRNEIMVIERRCSWRTNY